MSQDPSNSNPQNADAQNNNGAGQGAASTPIPSNEAPTTALPPQDASAPLNTVYPAQGASGVPVVGASVPRQGVPIDQTRPQSAGMAPGYQAGVGAPKKKSWWNLPKLIVAGVLVVLLAGFGGGAIGYSIGEHNAPHHQFKNGQYRNGAGGFGNGENRPGSGTGSGSGQKQGGSNSGSNSGGTSGGTGTNP